MKASKHTAPTRWHPSFRLVEDLPDTKVIRTAFAVNAVAVVALLAAGAFLVTREMETAALRKECAAIQRDIDAAKPKLTQALALQREFSAEEKKAREIETFLTPKVVASDFLAIISKTLPRMITLDSIEMSSTGGRIRGTVMGASERSAPLAKNYAEQLAEHPVLKQQMASIRLKNQVREQVNDRFSFEIELEFKKGK